jgi:hypothetical protein
MSATGNDPAGFGPGPEGPDPSEEELRAAYEAEVKKIRVEHVVLENIVTLINLGMRRTGLAPGTESERDPAQVRLAIESVRVLLPLIEQTAPQQVGPIRDAVSQLQMAFVRIGGQAPSSPPPPGPEAEAPAGDRSEPSPPPPPGEPEEAPAQPGEPGPAQRSGRLWIPGQ